MSNSAKTFIIIIILVVAAGAGIFLAKRASHNKAQTTTTETSTETATEESDDNQTPAVETDLIFFYGSTCPHCKKVEEFFSTSKVARKVSFEQKEVYGSKENADLMTEKQKLCKTLSEDDKGGVPFLFGDSGNVCIVGDQPIIDYFKERFSI